MENKPKTEHLPIYGVGPFYGVGIILSTIICIVLSAIGVLNSGKIHNTVFMIVFILAGVLIIIGGCLVWKLSPLFGIVYSLKTSLTAGSW